MERQDSMVFGWLWNRVCEQVRTGTSPSSAGDVPVPACAQTLSEYTLPPSRTRRGVYPSSKTRPDGTVLLMAIGRAHACRLHVCITCN